MCIYIYIYMYIYICRSYILNSFRELYRGLYRSTTIEVIKGNTRSLDYSSNIYIYICTHTHIQMYILVHG